ncbi:HNH endonuclease [Flavobacterium aquiphilum]|uniref:HNH endonuclease n=1 Tax=Flavobacterium aquiphilum TaxID=3003261 RepID=UPI002481928F|nr:HNH endonuclease signature motif containing protein [Flavobacterium aquiphilum]
MANKPKKVVRSWVKERVAFDRELKDDKFYNSWPWRKARKAFINKNPLCVHCEENGEVTAATVVDHKIPIKQGGEPLNESNFQSLCEKCHNKKSANESRGYGVKSR